MKIRLLATVLAAAFLLSGISGCSKKETKKNKDRSQGKDIIEPIEDRKVKDDEVAFTVNRSNYAWGYYDSTSFIMGNGDVYMYSNYLTLLPGTSSQEDKLDYLLEYTTPCYKIDTKYLEKLYETAAKIDPEAERIEKSVACDMGQSAVYLGNISEKNLLLSLGDWEIRLDDDNADDFEKLWNDVEAHTTTCEGNICGIYTDELPVISYRCGYLPEAEDICYLMDDYDQLVEAYEYWGLDTKDIEDLDQPYLKECPFLVQVINVDSSGYQLIYNGLMENHVHVNFITSEDIYSSDPNDKGSDEPDGFITVCPYLGDIPFNDLEANGWSSFEK